MVDDQSLLQRELSILVNAIIRESRIRRNWDVLHLMATLDYNEKYVRAHRKHP